MKRLILAAAVLMLLPTAGWGQCPNGNCGPRRTVVRTTAKVAVSPARIVSRAVSVTRSRPAFGRRVLQRLTFARLRGRR